MDAAPLLDWYAAVARPLPWRETTDPYAVLVSEVMLQQTQAARVVPYYERWLDRFPTAAALAGAPARDVLPPRGGLGYHPPPPAPPAAPRPGAAAGRPPGERPTPPP